MSESGLPLALEETTGRLVLSVFGAVRATVGTHEVRIRSRKSRAVLAYLALNDSGQETRERLVGLLWSESEEEKARANLRQVLHELRAALERAGYSGLRAERQTLELDRGTFGVDLHDVLHWAEHHRAHDSVLDQPRIAHEFTRHGDFVWKNDMLMDRRPDSSLSTLMLAPLLAVTVSLKSIFF